MVDGSKSASDVISTEDDAPSISLHKLARESTPATPDCGLSDGQVSTIRLEVGFNEVTSDKTNPLLELGKRYLQPVPLLMLVAIVLSAAVQKSEWLSFALLFIELHLVVYSAWKSEVNTASAISALEDTLAPEILCKRNNEWKDVKIRELVPGDIVLLKGGVVVPADATLRGPGEPMKIDESAITGESLPVTKYPNDSVLSGGVVNSGELEAQIYATGPNTMFGKSLALLAEDQAPGRLQVVTKRLQFAIILAGGLIGTILFFVQLFRGTTVSGTGDNFRTVFVFLIAGAPITLPVVVTTVLAVGAKEMARNKAVVSRLSAIEELAGIDVLCSDKTGTLTLNQLQLDTPWLLGKHTENDIMMYAALASKREGAEAIDTAIFRTTPDEVLRKGETDFQITRFVPFNPTDKKTEATVVSRSTGSTMLVSKGSPDVINLLCNSENREQREKVNEAIADYASRGLRSLGVAIKDEKLHEWQMVGLLALLDPPRHDTAEVIENAGSLFVDVKMITGDQLAIAIETARRLGMGTSISGPEIWRHTESNRQELPKVVEEVNGFAGVFPEQKFQIVEQLQRNGHVVGMTGDGVNDAAALKKANVGIAVAGATEAAKGASDIVLSEPGLGTIITAINRARKTFQILQNYVIYRIYISFHIYMFLFLLSVALQTRFPSWSLVVFSLFNDVTVASSSKDRVPTSQRPLSWRIGRLAIISLAVGCVGVLESFLLAYLADADLGAWWSAFNLDQLNEEQLRAAIWLHLMLSVNQNILLTRTNKFFLNPNFRPSLWVFGYVIALSIGATFAAVYWPIDFAFGSEFFMAGIGWRHALIVWAYRFGFLFVTEGVKLVSYYLLDKEEIQALRKKFALRKNRRLLMRDRLDEEGVAKMITDRLNEDSSDTVYLKLNLEGVQKSVKELEELKGSLLGYFRGEMTKEEFVKKLE